MTRASIAVSDWCSTRGESCAWRNSDIFCELPFALFQQVFLLPATPKDPFTKGAARFPPIASSSAAKHLQDRYPSVIQFARLMITFTADRPEGINFCVK
jgi:hypothetical protein